MTTTFKQYDLTGGLWKRLGDPITLTPGAIPPGPVVGTYPASAVFPSLTLYPTDGTGRGIGE